MIYLDWAATAPVYASILDAVAETGARIFGNPSALHYAGRKAAQLIDDSRIRIASFVGCKPEEVVFTSGATEANNMVLFSILRRYAQEDMPSRNKRKIIISGIEHPSVYDAARSMQKLGFTVKVIRAAATGQVDPADIAAALDKETVLVALLAVSNETGVLQPVQEVSRIVKEHSAHQGRRILMHTDAVQALGKTDFRFSDCGADSAVISAHKIGGFKGSGALVIKTGSSYDFLYKGGSQEQGRRPGTENLLGIYSFAAAVEQTQLDYETRLQKARGLMEFFCSRVKQVPGVHFIPAVRQDGNTGAYSPFIVKIAFPPVPGEVLVRVLEDKGILVSTGSACTSDNRPKMLRVLLNMQVPEHIAYSAIRVSIGTGTTETELTRLCEVLQAEVPQLMKLSG